MKKYLTVVMMRMTKTVEANSEDEALELAYDEAFTAVDGKNYSGVEIESVWGESENDKGELEEFEKQY